MDKSRLKKIFGIGPVGAVFSLLLLAVFSGLDFAVGHPALVMDPVILKSVGGIFILLGLGLHFWAFLTLRSWWANDELCTKGPFLLFRHPMYAAWITFIASGVALYFNSWILLLWVPALHPVWHKLVEREETVMLGIFGDVYKDYAKRTGRFVPRVFNRNHA
jgi:protein-S-isoprenylcysteine O-methyltransferase Ste14